MSSQTSTCVKSILQLTMYSGGTPKGLVLMHLKYVDMKEDLRTTG